jgi:hypothetical protein
MPCLVKCPFVKSVDFLLCTPRFLEERRGSPEEASAGHVNYNLGMAGKGSNRSCVQRTGNHVRR